MSGIARLGFNLVCLTAPGAIKFQKIGQHGGGANSLRFLYSLR